MQAYVTFSNGQRGQTVPVRSVCRVLFYGFPENQTSDSGQAVAFVTGEIEL